MQRGMYYGRTQVPSRLLLIVVMVLPGCVPTLKPEWVANPNVPSPEYPVANLPISLHQRNWVDRNGSGSCVHASTVYALRWMGAYDLANRWQHAHAGGETEYSIRRFYEAENIRFVSTKDPRDSRSGDWHHGDPGFLDWVTATRRAAIVWFKPSHCCCFVGFSVINGREYAVIQDNNYPGTFEKYPREEFISAWRACGGFGAVPLVGPPQAPLPWPSIVPIY